MHFKRYKINNIGWLWRQCMMDQTQASLTPAISERQGAETAAVSSLIITYLGLFTLCVWYQQFRLPYIHTENFEFYWEVIKLDPFSDIAKTYLQMFFKEISGLYILQWAFFITVPIISIVFFLIARAKLKKLPMHEAAEGGRLLVLGRTMALFIKGKWQLLMLFSVGYSFFATSGFSGWLIELTMGRGAFDSFSLFFPIMSLVLVWLLLRPFMAFYIMTISKKS